MALQPAQISAVLPAGASDGTSGQLRLSTRRDLFVTPVGGGFYSAVIEGGYFRAINAAPGTGIAIGVQAAFSPTANVSFTLRNTDTAGASARSLYLDYVRLICTAPGTGPTALDAAVVVDSANRVSVAGTALTAGNVNTNYSAPSVALPAFGIVTATAEASPGSRRVSRLRLKTGALVAGDTFVFNFASNGTSAGDLGPALIGPGGTLLIHLWTVGATVAPSFEVECGWWER